MSVVVGRFRLAFEVVARGMKNSILLKNRDRSSIDIASSISGRGYWEAFKNFGLAGLGDPELFGQATAPARSWRGDDEYDILVLAERPRSARDAQLREGRSRSGDRRSRCRTGRAA